MVEGKKKLVVMIPAYNEEKTIGKVIREIPRRIEGIREVKVLVVDDGSTDNTVKSANDAGADYIVKNTKNQGLAFSFQRGIDVALKLGADIVVNTDADFQYNQTEIPKLIKPILMGKADIVSGNRQVKKLDHMISAKKYGNMFGTKVVQMCAGYKIKDASSGFRAYNKNAMQKIFVTSSHTYTHQTLIQATHKQLKVIEVDVEFRKRTGKSKLIKSVGAHIKKSMSTIIRTTLMYNPLKSFTYFGGLLFLFGLYPMIRWFYLTYYLIDGGDHLQSLLLGTLLIIFGGFSILLGFIADLLAINRKYMEEVLYRLKKGE